MILLPHLFLWRFIAGKIHKIAGGFFIGHRLWSCELGKSTVLIVQLAMVHRWRTVTRAGFNQQILGYYNGDIWRYVWVFSSDFSISLQTSHDFSIGMGHNPFLPLVTVKITMISMDVHSRFWSIPTWYLWRCVYWRYITLYTRPGKHTKNYGKSPCFMGKSTINSHVQ